MPIFEGGIIDFLLTYEVVVILIIVIFSVCLILSLTFLFMDISKKRNLIYLNHQANQGQVVVAPNSVVAPASATSPAASPAPSDSAGPKVAHRFPTLSDFDEAHPSFEEVVPDPSLTLRGLVEGFRDYAASAKGLYYSRADVRAFLCSLSCSHTMILQGMSGTGKTSLPVAVGEWLASPTEVIPVQPTWKERSDILGYYNEFTGAYS